ncbi:MAG: sulfatase-like hydrolase/transferase, partial [Planctomycetaceae bacterium]|nr:sulfatase-like hydrolase/transferase [Planctomycetaceae bacterium]
DNGGVMDDGYQDGSGSDTSGHRCNGPLRGFKGGLYEGGTRVPLIARWPGKIPPGAEVDQLVGLVDVFATAAELVNRPLPEGAAPDSISFLSILLGKPSHRPAREALIEQAGGGRLAIRQGTWKLIPAPAGAPRGRDELYQLADDLAEERNLAAELPAKVQELKALLADIQSGR